MMKNCKGCVRKYVLKVRKLCLMNLGKFYTFRSKENVHKYQKGLSSPQKGENLRELTAEHQRKLSYFPF